MNNYEMKPDNNMVWAILCTVCCCLPLGVVSVIYASKVDGLYLSGNYEEAQDASNKAKKYAMWGAGIAAIGCLLYILFYVIIFVFAVATSN